MSDRNLSAALGEPRLTASQTERGTTFVQSFQSTSTYLQMLDRQLAQASFPSAGEKKGTQDGADDRPPTKPLSSGPGRIKLSPRCQNLAVISKGAAGPNQCDVVRPPGTPPPTPTPYGQENATETYAVGLTAQRSISNGRRYVSAWDEAGHRADV